MVRPCHCSLCGNKLDELYGPPPWGAALREQVPVPFSVCSRSASSIRCHQLNVSCIKTKNVRPQEGHTEVCDGVTIQTSGATKKRAGYGGKGRFGA